MMHALSVLLFASIMSGVIALMADILVREKARIVDAIRMVPQPVGWQPLPPVTRVRFAASPRPAVMRPALLREAA